MKNFKYNNKPILLIGLIFLGLFPLIFGGVAWFLGFFRTAVFYGLGAIYAVDLIIIGGLLLNSWNRTFVIGNESISFNSQLLSRKFGPSDIQDIMLYATLQGKEFLRIRTKRKSFFLDEHYQAWGTLLTEIEKYAKTNNIVSNLVD